MEVPAGYTADEVFAVNVVMPMHGEVSAMSGLYGY